MIIAYYPAIVERGADGFGVFFPDLPGCTSTGDTLQEAARVLVRVELLAQAVRERMRRDRTR